MLFIISSLSFTTSASHIFNILPLRCVNALGQGLSPLIRHSICLALLVKSSSPIDFLSILTYELSASFCFSGIMLPVSSPSSVLIRSLAPTMLNLSKRLPPVSFLSSLTLSTKRISPVSSPSSIFIVVTPEYSHPSITAHWIGEAPLYLGSSEACTLIHPRRGISIILLGNSCPNATTTNTSALYFLNSSTNASSLALSG